MTNLVRGLAWGAVAGAAGTTALNLVTYVDMAIRARPASQAPQQLVEELSLDAGVTLPGDADTRKTRVEGIGPLAGLLTGIAVGAAAGALRSAGVRLPAVLAAPAIGAAAMASVDVPLVLTKVSDPTTWTAAEWAADAVPHLVYGAVVHAVVAAADK